MASAGIKIESGIPLPRVRGNDEAKYPFKEMRVGDSFVALLSESRSPDLPRLQTALLNCARHALGGSGKVATRKLPDGSGFRVWRIA